MSRVSALYRLQEIDADLDARRARLRSVETALNDSAAVQAAQRMVVEVEAQLHVAQARLKQSEHQTQTLSEKIAGVEGRLYGGAVTAAKELQELQMELESLKRRRDHLEEEQLEALILVETTQARHETLQADLARAEDEAARLNSHLVMEHTELKARIARLEASREGTLASISKDNLQTYERLRQAKHGRALSRVEDGVCTACGVAPSAARLQSVRQGQELTFCGNCGRILYLD